MVWRFLNPISVGKGVWYISTSTNLLHGHTPSVSNGEPPPREVVHVPFICAPAGERNFDLKHQYWHKDRLKGKECNGKQWIEQTREMKVKGRAAANHQTQQSQPSSHSCTTFISYPTPRKPPHRQKLVEGVSLKENVLTRLAPKTHGPVV